VTRRLYSTLTTSRKLGSHDDLAIRQPRLYDGDFKQHISRVGVYLVPPISHRQLLASLSWINSNRPSTTTFAKGFSISATHVPQP